MSATHLDPDATQRLLHGELSPPAERSWRAHLATCATCRSRLEEATREEALVFGLLRQLDHRPPDVRHAQVVGAAESSEGSRRWQRWAAGVVLAAGLSGAAYAAPGSPLRRFVQSFGRAPAAAPVPAPSVPVPAVGRPAPARPAPALPADSGGGLTILPGARLTIVFAGAWAGGFAGVTLTDDAEVAVRALRGAARFTSETDRLVVETDDAATSVEIRIPRAAPRLEIRVGRRPVFRKDGARIRTRAARDASGTYRVSLVPPNG